MRLGRLAAAGLCAFAACGPPRVPVRVSAPDLRVTTEAKMAAAAALVRAGCLDCLIEAFQAYDALRAVPVVAEAATAAAARTATLIALRERELGAEESGTLARAHELAAAAPALTLSSSPLFEIVDTLSARTSGASSAQVASEAQLNAATRAYRNRTLWTEGLRLHADEDELAAYLWFAFNCMYGGPTNDAVAGFFDVVPSWRETPLVQFRGATCGAIRTPVLEGLLNADPRFVEITYFLGLQAILRGSLDDADSLFQRAYAWRPRWPAVTYSLANLSMTAEDFERAAQFYDRTLELVADHADALLGKARALIYLGRYSDALATINALLALGHWYVGDAHYWRAVGEVQLERNDDAWDDIEQADKLISNADVPKLAGIIAARRNDLPVARAKFELAHARNMADCETAFYLGSVLADQRAWDKAVEAFAWSASCFEGSQRALEQQIARLRASTMAAERRDRQIARRERQMATDARTLATSWFNLAAGCFNLSRYIEAREYAEKVANDPQFAGRVRDLVARIPVPRGTP